LPSVNARLTWELAITLGAIGLLGCVDEQLELPREPADQATATTDEDLTALLALPYLSWSDEEADPEKLGVTIWDEERAWNGYNLYTNDVNEAYLMDMGGRRLHSWILSEEYAHCAVVISHCRPAARLLSR